MEVPYIIVITVLLMKYGSVGFELKNLTPKEMMYIKTLFIFLYFVFFVSAVLVSIDLANRILGV
jgi:hypothetical protein